MAEGADKTDKKFRPLHERKQAFAEQQAQRVVENWPVLDLGDCPEIDRSEWMLMVDTLA